MNRGALLKLARGGLAMPIRTDLLLHECGDPESVRRWRIPLAVASPAPHPVISLPNVPYEEGMQQ